MEFFNIKKNKIDYLILNNKKKIDENILLLVM